MLEDLMPYILGGLVYIPFLGFIDSLVQLDYGPNVKDNWLYYLALVAFHFLFLISHC